MNFRPDILPKRKSVLITGVSTGIGAALALEFARRGDVVTGLSRNRRALGSLQEQILRRGGRCTMVTCDVRKPGQVKSAVRRGRRGGGSFDVAVNNAGVTVFRDFARTSISDFDAIMETNLRGAFLVTREILPSMIKKKQGLIVNVISYATKTIYTGSAAYSAAKAGVEAMMKVLREEVREKNIRIINVYPGAVLTPMWSRTHREKFGDSMIPVEHLAKLICDMSSQPLSMTTEEIIVRPPVGDLNV